MNTLTIPYGDRVLVLHTPKPACYDCGNSGEHDHLRVFAFKEGNQTVQTYLCITCHTRTKHNRVWIDPEMVEV